MNHLINLWIGFRYDDIKKSLRSEYQIRQFKECLSKYLRKKNQPESVISYELEILDQILSS